MRAVTASQQIASCYSNSRTSKSSNFSWAGRYPGVDQVLRIAAAVRRLAAENDGQAIEQPVEALHEALPDIGTNKLRIALSLMREIAMVCMRFRLPGLAADIAE